MGMALVVLSITSGKGLQHAIMDKFRALEGDFTIQAYSLNRTEEWRPIALEDSLFTELSQVPYVDQIFPVVQKTSLLGTQVKVCSKVFKFRDLQPITSSTSKNLLPLTEVPLLVDMGAGFRAPWGQALS